jgi:hypothetical protein
MPTGYRVSRSRAAAHGVGVPPHRGVEQRRMSHPAAAAVRWTPPAAIRSNAPADLEAHDRYQAHPIHEAFVREFSPS